MINRLNDYTEGGFPEYKKEDTEDPNPTKPGDQVFRLKDAAEVFFKSASGCVASLIYLQLARMVVGAITTLSVKGAEKLVLRAFQVILTNQMDEYLKEEDDGQTEKV